VKPITQREFLATHFGHTEEPEELRRFFADVLGWRPVTHPERRLTATEFGLLVLRKFIDRNWSFTNEMQRASIIKYVRKVKKFTDCCKDCWDGADRVDGFHVSIIDNRYVRVQGGDGVLATDSLEILDNLPGPHIYSCIIDTAPLYISAMKDLEGQRNAADAQKRNEPRVVE